VAEGARLESVFRGNSNVGSNPTLSASFYFVFKHLSDALTSTDVHSARHGLFYDPPMSLPHRVHHPSAVSIQRGLNGCVPHEFVLDREALAIVPEPRPVGVLQGMTADRS
jgi:hypothetical protein